MVIHKKQATGKFRKTRCLMQYKNAQGPPSRADIQPHGCFMAVSLSAIALLPTRLRPK